MENIDNDDTYLEVDLFGTILQINKQGIIYRKLNYPNSVKWRKTNELACNGHGYNYVCIGRFGKIARARIMAYIYLHLDLTNKNQIVDHIDRNPLNNKLSNLRILTPQQNQFNRGAKGWSYNISKQKNEACIRINKKLINLGTYDTPEEAHNAYLEAKQKHHII
jgi:hypothetical protein